MSAQMDMDDELYRVPVFVSYDIEYHQYKNGQYDVPDGFDTHVEYEICLGPYGFESMANTQAKRWRKHFEDSKRQPNPYKNLVIKVYTVQKASWVTI